MNPKALLVFVLPLALVGCLHAPVGKPHMMGAEVTPPNPAVVSACESTRTWHNTWSMIGTIFGGLAGAGGTVDGLAQNNAGVQTGAAIGAAGSGIIAAISATASSIEADTYATNNCAAILQQAANAAASSGQ